MNQLARISKCSICGKTTQDGNNPFPLRDSETQCCKRCNDKYVIPVRIALTYVKDNNTLYAMRSNLMGASTKRLDKALGYN